MQIWALVLDSFRESCDRKIFWVLLVISGVITLSLACVGFDENGWSFFFGLYTIDNEVYRLGNPEVQEFYGSLISGFLIDLYIGWIGVGVALVATAGIFPNLMQSGTIDVILAKPLGRWKLFFGKYVGSLGFVFLHASVFILSTFLVIGWRADIWLWGYLWCIPLLVLLFSYVYSFCVLVSIRTKSTLSSLLIAFGFWFACFLVQNLHSTLMIESVWGEQGKLQQAVAVTRAVLPKTSDVAVIAGELAGAGSVFDFLTNVGVELNDDELQAGREAESAVTGVSIPLSVGSSLGFEAVVLLIAGILFRRRDF